VSSVGVCAIKYAVGKKVCSCCFFFLWPFLYSVEKIISLLLFPLCCSGDTRHCASVCVVVAIDVAVAVAVDVAVAVAVLA